MNTEIDVKYKEGRTDDSYRVWLFCNQKFAGNIKLVPMPTNVKYDLPQEYQDSLYLADLNVNPEHRRKGFGSSLLEKALGFAKEKQKLVVLVAHPRGEGKTTQEEIINFYLKKGFRKLDVKLRNCLYYNPQDESKE